MRTPTSGADLLAGLAARWRRRRDLAAAVVAVCAGVAVAAATHAWLGPASSAPAGLVAAVGAGLAARLRWPAVGPDAVARHLNRTTPPLEESAELLLRPPEQLGVVGRLQRARVEAAVSPLLRTLPRLPHRPLRLAVLLGPSLLGAGLVLGYAGIRPGDGSAAQAVTGPAGEDGEVRPARVTDVEIRVRSPQYTGLPTRRQSEWDLEVPEGAQVTWRIRTDRPAALAILTAAGDSIPFEPTGGAEHVGRWSAERSTLYRLAMAEPEGRRGGAARSDFHRLTVTGDAPPLITVVRPTETRATVPLGAPALVALHALATDDHGLTDVSVLATVTKGRGEGVSFREVTLPFDRSSRRGSGRDLRKTFDLDDMGLDPGDELYFQVVARDNRRPTANESRSETFFVIREDTAAVPAGDGFAIAVERVPEYFRSQRQIIIDTERLLAERGGLTVAAFRDRSDAIGFDQHLLRLRYGELVGDETDDGAEAAGTDPPLHAHDSEENATLLATQVRDTLRAALAQMWDAERHLRTYAPETALPYEYRALELLKRVQQSARRYVLRAGYEPPPLEPDRIRLTGKREGILDRTTERTQAPAAELNDVRRAHRAVRGALLGEPGDRSLVPLLEAAGQELARLAVDEPGPLLDVLGHLRVLSDTLDRGDSCRACLERVASGLWRALPPPDPSSGAQAGPIAPMARWYFDLLQGPR